MARHIHRPQGEATERCWSYCVADGPCNQMAHGNIVRTHTCKCGATRDTEINMHHRKYGPWAEPKEGQDSCPVCGKLTSDGHANCGCLWRSR